MKNDTLYLALYYERVSTEHEEQDLSMRNQRSLCDNFLKKNRNIKLAEPVDKYVERISGKSDARPKYKALIQRLKQGDIDFLLIKDFKRLNRSSEVSAQMKNLSKKYSFKFILLSTGQIYDPNAPENRMMYGFESLLNEEVVYRQSEYARLAHKQKCQEKRLNRNNITFGYKWEEDDIVIDEKNARIVQELFELYVFKDYGISELRKHLLLKYQLRRSGNTVRKWIHETAYIGVFHLNKKGSELGVGVGQKTKRFDNPKEEWVPVLRPDLAIVDKRIFELAQRISDSRNRTYNGEKDSVKFKGKHLFSSVIYCKECKSSYVHDYADRKKQIAIYRDSTSLLLSKNILKECQNQKYKRVYEDDMKRIVVETLTKMVNSHQSSFDDVANILEGIIIENNGRNNIQQEKQREIERIKITLEKTKSAYIDAKPGVLRDDIEKDYQALVIKYKEAKQELSTIQEKINDVNRIKKQIKDMRDAVMRLKNIEEKSLNRNTIRSFIQRIYVSKEGEIEVIFHSFDEKNESENTQVIPLFSFDVKEKYLRRNEDCNRVLSVQVGMCA